MGTHVGIAPDVTAHGFATEKLTQAELHERIRAFDTENETIWSYIRGGQASDARWEKLGRNAAQIVELTRRMIVRRREDRYQQAAASLAHALDMVPLPGLAFIYMMSGRMENLASWILDQPESLERPHKDPYQEARLVAPEVINARNAMAEPTWQQRDKE